MSLLDVQFGTRLSQVLMHCGTVLGQGYDGAGLEVDSGEVPLGPGAGTTVTGIVEAAPLLHSVQAAVAVEVKTTVERELVVTTTEDPPVVIVLVTGQVVTVVYVMIVAVEPSGTGEVDSGLTPEGNTTVGAELVSAGTVPSGTEVEPSMHLVQTVETEVQTTVEIEVPVVT